MSTSESAQDSSSQSYKGQSFGGPYSGYALEGGRYIEFHGAGEERREKFVREHPTAITRRET